MQGPVGRPVVRRRSIVLKTGRIERRVHLRGVAVDIPRRHRGSDDLAMCQPNAQVAVVVLNQKADGALEGTWD